MSELIVRPIKVAPIVSKHNGNLMFPLHFCNILVLARKQSGKTSLISHIIKHSVNSYGNDTNVSIFSPTFDKDPLIMELIDTLSTNEKVHVFAAHHFNQEVNYLDTFLATPPHEEVEENYIPMINFPGMRYDQMHEKGKKFDNILYFDDLGEGVLDRSFTQLLKVSRHYNSRVICSGHWNTDQKPSAFKQYDYVILFGNQEIAKLRQIFDRLSLSISYPTFLEYYNFATREKYSFLYIDVANQKFRRNFDTNLN